MKEKDEPERYNLNKEEEKKAHDRISFLLRDAFKELDIKDKIFEKKGWTLNLILEGINSARKNATTPIFIDEQFNGINFKKIDISSCEFLDCSFNSCILKGCGMEHSDFTDSVFKNCNISEANLIQSNLIQTEFLDCTVAGANFQSANLVRTVFKDTSLEYAKNIDYREAVDCVF